MCTLMSQNKSTTCEAQHKVEQPPSCYPSHMSNMDYWYRPWGLSVFLYARTLTSILG